MRRVFPTGFPSPFVAGRTHMVDEHDVIWRPQGVDAWILNYTAEGSGRIGHGVDQLATRVGQLLLFKPLAVHDYGRAAEASSWLHWWVYFTPRPTWREYLDWPEVAPGVLGIDLAGHPYRPRIVVCFDELIDCMRGPLPRRAELAANLLEQLLLWTDAGSELPGQQRIDRRLRGAVEHCHAHYAERLTIDALAGIAGLSPSRFSHLFRDKLGVAPLVYLEQLRMTVARELLVLSDRRIQEIATSAGYADPVWFARVFRRRVGCTPRQFRQRALTRRA